MSECIYSDKKKSHWGWSLHLSKYNLQWGWCLNVSFFYLFFASLTKGELWVFDELCEGSEQCFAKAKSWNRKHNAVTSPQVSTAAPRVNWYLLNERCASTYIFLCERCASTYILWRIFRDWCLNISFFYLFFASLTKGIVDIWRVLWRIRILLSVFFS